MVAVECPHRLKGKIFCAEEEKIHYSNDNASESYLEILCEPLMTQWHPSRYVTT